MAKTLAQILTDARQIIGESDSSNSRFTDAQLTIWANDSYRDIFRALASGSRGGAPTKVDYTVSAQSVSLNTTLMRLDTVRFNVQPEGKWVELDSESIETMNEKYPDWENDDTGVPVRYVRTGTFTISLHPSPNAANLSQTLRTYGIYMPTALSASSDTPDLPEHCHDMIPHYIAYRCFSGIEQGERSIAELTLYRGMLKEGKGIAQNLTTKRKGFRFVEHDD